MFFTFLLKNSYTYCLQNLAKILGCGVPSTECILESWSISFAPGNSGLDL